MYVLNEVTIPRQTMKNYISLCLTLCISACLVSCNSLGEAQLPKEDFVYFLTRLGNDTLAIEKAVYSNDTIEASVVLRSPKTRLLTYKMTLTDGNMNSFAGAMMDPATKDITTTHNVFWQGDSLNISLNDGERQTTLKADPTILPFIDMVHWPFELMLQRTYQSGVSGKIIQPLWAGTRTFNFEIENITEDSMTITHPTRGTMGVTVNQKGQLVTLEASRTTRRLTVERLDKLDFDGLTDKFIEKDLAGKGFGALSGRGKVDKDVAGVHFTVDYGTPSKRGRKIWGSLVKYGERWRTGANRATHFTTNADLEIGGLEVPAGDYTFFTIPQESECTLIINKQTGQNGRTYDDSKDLGRVMMQSRTLEDVVEVFTIDIYEKDGDLFLSLAWDDKAYDVLIKK